MLIIIPIPGYDCYFEDEKAVHFLSELLIIGMFLRLYLIMKTYLYQSEYADAFSMKISKAYGFESSGISYNFKCLYFTSPERAMGMIFFGTIFIFAYIIRIVEAAQIDSFFKAIYFTVITLTTIGYGDICPATKLGQICVMVFACWCTVLLAFVVGAAMSVFDLAEC